MARKNKRRDQGRQEQPQQDRQTTEVASRPSARPLVQQLGLPLLVFTAGAVLMALEIAGSRVLAPHFGNSVFVWGSLISVFLTALSLGYYLGGHVADRYPTHLLLNSICVVVSLLIFLIAVSAYRVCAVLAESGLGEESGPLIASMLLFLPPSVGMGMVSPFAVRLATRSLTSVGSSAGKLYALSTMGSIAGTLLTTFVLIPLLGLSAILKGLALVLLLVSLLTLPLGRSANALLRVGVFALAVLVCLSWPAWSRTPLRPGDRVLVDVDTAYHHIAVVDNGELRELKFGRYVESAILKTPPYRSLAGYTDYFHLCFLLRPDIKRALFIGAGGGVGPRAFHMHDPKMAIDVVDIDPKVLEIARTHFFLEECAQIRTTAEDGRMFLRKAEGGYDCVILDAFTIGGRIPFHLVTSDFLGLCRDRMTEDGVFLMNINSAIDGPSARIFHSMYRTLTTVFSHTYVFAVDHRLGDRSRSTNIILIGTRAEDRLSTGEWAARAERHRSDSYIDSHRMQGMVADLLADLPDVSQAPVFTDDYAPIEMMSF